MRTRLAASLVALCLLLGAPALAQQQPVAPAVQQARGLAGKQDYKGARAGLLAYLASSPGDAAAQELLGFCAMKLFLFDEACDAFSRGDAGDKYHEVNWGYCLRKAGRLVEALSVLKRGQARIGANDSWSSYCQDQVAELEPLAGAKAVLCCAQADDFVVAAVNGKAIGRARSGGEAAYVLDGKLKPGRNEVRALAVNTAGPWAYRVRLYLGGKLAFSSGSGYAAKGQGAFDNDQTVGVVGDARMALEVAADGAASLVEGRDDVDFAPVVERIRESEGLWREGRFGEAIKIYEKAGKEWPSLDWFHLRLAEACDELALTMQDATTEAAGKRDRLRKAAAAARERWIAVRKRVADLSGDDAGAWQAYATACSSISKFDDAEAAFKKALSLEPGRVEAMVGLADALVKQGGKGAEAKEWAEKAIEKAPHWSAAHCLLGDALLDQGDGRAALASYNRAVELDPTQGEWMYGKIAAAVNRGGANAAGIRDATRAVSESKNDAALQKAYGDALVRGLKWEEALRAYQTALALAPDLPGVHPLMGLCYELTGKRDRAIQSYEKGAKDPDDALRSLSERRMARAKEIAAAPARSYAPPPAKAFEAAGGDGKTRAAAELDVIKAVRPKLAEALRGLPPLRDGEVTAAEAVACERIQRVVQSSRARDELKRGLSLMEREAGERKGAPRVDGDLSEWQPKERVATDPAGDAPAGADLVEVYAVVRGTDLYVAWKTYGAPRVRTAWFWAHVYSPKRGTGWLAVGVGPDEGMVVKVAPDGTRENMSASQAGMELSVGAAGIEAKVPLSWIDGERRLQVEAYTLAGQQKLDTAGESQPPVPIDDGYSPSLLALFRLAEDGAFEADDRPALAIALASGDLYALGDPALSAAVAEDDRRMLRLSRTVKLWQKGMGLPALDSLPLPPLLFWANRCVQWRPTDLAEYRRYSISPAALEGMFKYAQKHGFRGRAIGDVVEAAEKFLIDPVRWQYTSYEMVARGIRARAGESVTLSEAEKRDLNKFVRDVVIDGKRQNTDGTFNPDLQFDYLVATDALLGHCGNLAQTVVDFARAVGAPATIVQGIEEQSKRYQNPHAFPTYFDGASKTWKSYQGRKYKGIRQLTLFFFLPPLEPPDGARPTGGGSYYFPVPTTYDDAGPLFSAGYEAPWLRDWMAGLGAAGK